MNFFSRICCCKKKAENNTKIIKNNQNEHTHQLFRYSDIFDFNQDLEYNKTLDISTNSIEHLPRNIFFKLSENEVSLNYEIHGYDSSGDVREMHATTELLGGF